MTIFMSAEAIEQIICMNTATLLYDQSNYIDLVVDRIHRKVYS